MFKNCVVTNEKITSTPEKGVESTSCIVEAIARSLLSKIQRHRGGSVTCVPRPHGADAGEESLKREVLQHPDVYQVIVVMDDGARRSIRRALDRRDQSIPVVAPTYMLYLLLDGDVIDRETFCTVCGEMLENEGWTGYKAVKIAWEQIPVSCDDVLDDDLLPR